MEFAVVNNYMGPVATKAMKGYSDEDISDINECPVCILVNCIVCLENVHLFKAYRIGLLQILIEKS